MVMNPRAVKAAQSTRLFERIREVMRLHHYSKRTEEAYLQWIKRFIYFHNKRHPRQMGADEITAYLTYLAVKRQVSASTQNQALNAILFLYRKVLDMDLPWLNDIVRAKRTRRLPVVFTREEVKAILCQFEGTRWLMFSLIYGCGLRELECLRLRVKDIDFHYRQVTVRDGKGSKDRVTMLPTPLIEPLRTHLLRVKQYHEQDLQAGYGCVYLPFALAKKYPNACREWGWAAPAHPCARGIRASLHSTLHVSLKKHRQGSECGYLPTPSCA